MPSSTYVLGSEGFGSSTKNHEGETTSLSPYLYAFSLDALQQSPENPTEV